MGNQKAIKLDRKFLEVAKEDGKIVRNGHVIINNLEGAKIIRDKNDPYGYRIKQPSGGIHMAENRKFTSMRSIQKYLSEAEDELGDGGYIGFSVMGNRSHGLYHSVQEAWKHFSAYASLTQAKGAEKKELLSSFTLYRVPRKDSTKWKPKRRAVKKYRRWNKK